MSDNGNSSGSVSVPRKMWWRALLRPLGTVTVLLFAYFLLPLRGVADIPALLLLVAGAVVAAAVCAWQVRRILRVKYPLVQAIEALAATFGCHIIGFATLYYVTAGAAPLDFNVPITRLDSLYFCVTVFTTVGFGDIVATAELTRGFVLVQMVANLILIGVALRVLTATVRLRRQQLADPDQDSGSR